MQTSANRSISVPTTRSPIHEFETIVDANLPMLLRIARRLAWPDHDLGSDLVQNAVIKAFRSLNEGKLQLTPNLGAWLKQAVYLEFLMHKRATKNVDYVATESFENRTAQTPRPFENQFSQEILDALASLPADQRILVILIDIEGHEYHEVSEMLNIPMGTVRSRLSRARWKLANQLHHLGSQS